MLSILPSIHGLRHKGKVSVPPESDGQFVLNKTARRTQYGAVCWRLHRGKMQVLLVTSRDTGRWIIPKGWPIEGLAPAEAALREAWEEAGVVGVAPGDCLGLFAYDKMLGPDRSLPCLVAVYAIRVDRLRNRFPERKERQRKWFSPDKAALKVDEEGLRQLLLDFSPEPAAGSVSPGGPAPAEG